MWPCHLYDELPVKLFHFSIFSACVGKFSDETYLK
jgi:hypothetical protein